VRCRHCFSLLVAVCSVRVCCVRVCLCVFVCALCAVCSEVEFFFFGPSWQKDNKERGGTSNNSGSVRGCTALVNWSRVIILFWVCESAKYNFAFWSLPRFVNGQLLQVNPV
jgi:hypothetical protein